MMGYNLIRSLSLKGKLMLIIMLTSTLGLLFASVFFGAYERYRVRQSIEHDLVVLGRLISDRSTAALLFDDAQSAGENLRALRFNSSVLAACIYDERGTVFASYAAKGSSTPFPAAEAESTHRHENNAYVVFEPIIMDGKRIGAVCIRASLEELNTLWRQFLLATTLIIVGAAAAAFYLSSRLQRVISEPLAQVAQAARLVTQKKDYSVRVAKTSDDEIAVLVQAFNEMLETIESQNKELIQINRNLEHRVTERTEQLAEAKNRAEEADRLKSAFLATMSHELRTPLNSIIGFNGILLQGLSGPINPEQAKQMRMVRESATHLLSLISDVLDISKIEAGQFRVESKSFDFRDSIMKTVQAIRPLAKKKDLEVNVAIAEQVGFLVSDQRRVEQVLLNLLSNAVKFTEKGSVSLSCEIQGDSCVTRVSDTGMGIAPEDIDKLFRPFRQIDTGLSRLHEGTGLGLSICKRLLELLHGSIQVESEPGKGSCFSFTLPLQTKQKQAEDSTPSSSP